MAEQLDVQFDIGASGTTYAEKYGFFDKENYAFRSKKGLNHEVVEEISWMKNEPDWMREFRHRSLDIFYKKPMPQWGGNLNTINFDDIYYFVRASEKQGRNWDEVPSDIKNTFDKLGIPEAEQKFLSGVGAQYECLSGDARVYTARGLVPIKDVIPTDVVFSLDEETNQLIPALVKATAAKGVRQVHQVRVGNRTIKATDNHPFLVLEYTRGFGKLRGRYHRTWKYLRELRPGDLVAVAKNIPDVGATVAMQQPHIKTTVVGRNQTIEYPLDITGRYNPITLPEATSSDLMWWLGLYLGDGYIHHTEGADKARVGLAIPETDHALRQEFARVTQELFELPAKNGDPYRMTVNSTILARYLEENGFDGNALTKRAPKWVFALPLEQKLAFLGGYLDADGYVRDHKSNHDLVLTSANHELLQDIQQLCAQCGINTSSIHRFEGKHPHDAERTMVGYRMELSGDFERIQSRSPQRTNRFGKRKYHHDYSSAKNTTFQSHTNEYFGFAKIDAITPVGSEEVYDIEVDGPHNFVAEGLIVHNSEVVYHSVKESLTKQGVIFTDTDSALKEYPDLFKKYFGTIIPPADNKFSALNSAVWSGGSFIYVPPGVHVDMPLQAYFRINTRNMGQFERTLIIVDEGAFVHYVEGCFLAGARVQTRDGLKSIENIQEGDEVFTHQGRFRRVYHTMQRPYRGNIYNIQYFGDSDQELSVTEEHPLLVVRRERANERNKQFSPEWLTAADVKPGDYLAIPIPQPEPQYDASKTVTVPLGRGRHEPVLHDVTLPMEPDFFRLVGYYFAEGHVDNEHYLSFSFHVNEKEYLDDARALITRYFGKAPIENKPRQNGQTLVLASTEIARTFAREFGSTVYDKRVPDYIRNAPLDALREWVRAMWRGDGSYDARKNMFRFNSISRELAYAFRDALLRLGIAASVNRQERLLPRQPIYAIVISSPCNARFGEIVGQPAPNGSLSGSPFYMDDKYMYVPIRAIEMEYLDTTVYNFSVEEDESYVCEGVVSHNCTAPTYTTDSLHSAVVEIIVNKGGRARYTTIQNWSSNVYNLVTKRTLVKEDGTMEWVDANLGSKLTMKYPSVYLMGKGAHGEVLSVAFAGKGQHQDAGGKAVHGAPHTTSQIISKSISKDGGRTSYRGLVQVYPGAVGSKSKVQCDALILDDQSRSDTYPSIDIQEDNVNIGHEASVSKIGEEQLFYLTSRGITDNEASGMIVNGFIEPVAKELPMEFAVELNRLINLQMEGSVG